MTIQAGVALNGVIEATMDRLLNDPSARLPLGIALVPGWLAALRYRSMIPRDDGASGSTGAIDDNTAKVGDDVIEEVSHWLIKAAEDARRLPPAAWIAFSMSGAVTLRAMSSFVSGTLPFQP